MGIKLFLSVIASVFCLAATNAPKPNITLKLEKKTTAQSKLSTKSKREKETSICAKVPLAAIYAAEKSYFSEYERFADEFDSIGYTEDSEQKKLCTDWSVRIRLGGMANEFEATAENLKTKELWKIDQAKNMVQENRGEL